MSIGFPKSRELFFPCSEREGLFFQILFLKFEVKTCYGKLGNRSLKKKIKSIPISQI